VKKGLSELTGLNRGELALASTKLIHGAIAALVSSENSIPASKFAFIACFP